MQEMSLDQRVLAALSQHQRLAIEFTSVQDPKLFADPNIRELSRVFKDYTRIYRSAPTQRVLLEEHQDNPVLIRLIKDFFSSVEGFSYDEQDYNFDIQKLKERYSGHLIKQLSNSLDSVEEDAEKVRNAELILTEIKAVNKEAAYSKKTLREYLPEFKHNYATKLKHPELGRGILTKYSFLDYIANGLQGDDLLVVAGESGSGKSFLLNNMAINIWLQNNNPTTIEDTTKGYNVVYFTLELSHERCFRRTISALADVPTYSVRDARLSKIQAEAVSRACKFIERYPCEFDIIDVPRGFSVEELEVHIQEVKNKYEPNIIFIDYMGLMENIEDESEDWLKLGNLAGKLHEFTRTYKIPIVTAVQLNRLNSRQTSPIGLHRIGRSSMIAHHSSIILQIAEREHEKSLPDLEYHVIKNRDGECGKALLRKNFANAFIGDIPYNPARFEGYDNDSIVDDISDDVAAVIGNIIKDA